MRYELRLTPAGKWNERLVSVGYAPDLDSGFKDRCLTSGISYVFDQALSEIDFVTKNLAQLIEQISKATQTQANATNKVAQNMQDILEITRQTTRGTQQAAGSIRDLATVAQELKSSVSGFKL